MRQPGWFVLFFVAGCRVDGADVQRGVCGEGGPVGATGLLDLVLALDLGRANLPWVEYWNYHEKYLRHPVVWTFCLNQPWYLRVTCPAETFTLFSSASGSAFIRFVWLHDQFPYYNIQSVDAPQMSRHASDLSAFMHALLVPRQSRTTRALGVRVGGNRPIPVPPGQGGKTWNFSITTLILKAPLSHSSTGVKIVPRPGRAEITEVYDATIVPEPDDESPRLSSPERCPAPNSIPPGGPSPTARRRWSRWSTIRSTPNRPSW